MLQDYQDVLMVEEVAEMLVMGRNGAYGLLLSGKLKGFRNGRVCGAAEAVDKRGRAAA